MDNNTIPINNISLGIRTKTFTIDNDPNRVIEIDPSDIGVVGRLDDAIPQIEGIINEFVDAGKKLSEEGATGFGETLRDLDCRLRDVINSIFDYDVCSVCVPKGTLFDVVTDSDQFKFEIIIKGISQVYETTISDDLVRVQNRITAHTQKYTGISRV